MCMLSIHCSSFYRYLSNINHQTNLYYHKPPTPPSTHLLPEQPFWLMCILFLCKTRCLLLHIKTYTQLYMVSVKKHLVVQSPIPRIIYKLLQSVDRLRGFSVNGTWGGVRNKCTYKHEANASSCCSYFLIWACTGGSGSGNTMSSSSTSSSDIPMVLLTSSIFLVALSMCWERDSMMTLITMATRDRPMRT